MRCHRSRTMHQPNYHSQEPLSSFVVTVKLFLNCFVISSTAPPPGWSEHQINLIINISYFQIFSVTKIQLLYLIINLIRLCKNNPNYLIYVCTMVLVCKQFNLCSKLYSNRDFSKNYNNKINNYTLNSRINANSSQTTSLPGLFIYLFFFPGLCYFQEI